MPPTEQTPLITTVIVTPPRPRYSHSYVRRFCTAALSLTLVVIIILFLVPGRWLPGNPSESEWFPWRHSGVWPTKYGLSYNGLQKIMLETPNRENIRASSKHYSSGPHLAGRNYSLALWTSELWQSYGLESTIVDYDVYLNYPLTHSLALLESIEGSTNDKPGSLSVKYQFSLEEDQLEEDPTSRLDTSVPTFHGYGANGNVTGRYVFANYGTIKDYDDLLKLNVNLDGLIAVVKYGKIFRGLKVKRAQELGMIGVIIYSDPGDDGDVLEQNGFDPYPAGPARQPSSVQRGSVQYIKVDIVSGDPTTPGYPSKPGVPRQDPHYGTPTIPSQPISYQEAIPILKSLNGHGPKASEINQDWDGGKLGYKGVEYNIGPSLPGLQLNLAVQNEFVTTPLWDVIGVINGTLQDEVVIIGNHRDAWIAGGAGDPNSGSAVLNEVIRSFSVALEHGWKPLRTIVFASWDGEEYSLIGSTEWVEEHMPWLKKAAVAYINVDVACTGPGFRTQASPLLHKALYEATSIVQSPNQTIQGQTVRDVWNGHISPMGSGSDFTAFQDFAGIPALDMAFTPILGSAIYHYHSNYDSFYWMENFGDSGWHYHATMAKIWGVLTASLVQNPIIGFNVTNYAESLQTYLELVRTNASASVDPSIRSTAFPAIEEAIEHLHEAASAFDTEAHGLSTRAAAGLPWWRVWRKARLRREIKEVNTQYQYFERKFLYEKGLDSRPLFKHVVFAPGLWTGYAGATFPGLIEAVDFGDKDDVDVSHPPLVLPVVILMKFS
ncbi:uncharacterized protein KY384_001391 [Bacidia gigantensis]|uniref:uncharacterized protein n=1 Tax=Bacidia gigantensis TaxID=2732470 RepID=UPI001D057315|nr:uncharacterized protein KY384_001391 [Bacidia gigantensis]KAG8533650.1 hypothetical protein KY384_001391 [Bacidia gigantensis]